MRTAQLADSTTDAMSLFLQEVRRHPLLTREQEVELARADRARGSRGQGAVGELEPAAGDLQRPQVPGPRPAAARPDPGGDPRADPGGREVRLPQRVTSSPRTPPSGSGSRSSARSRTARGRSAIPVHDRAARAEDRSRVQQRAGGHGSVASRPTRRSRSAAELTERERRETRECRPRGDEPRPPRRRGGGHDARIAAAEW